MYAKAGRAIRTRGMGPLRSHGDGLRRRTATCGALAMVQAVSMLLAAGAQAQTPACDQLKATLAARFESSGVRGYSMEAVPADTPVPAGAKVIGTCESGALKVVYRRWGAARPAADGASAVPAARPATRQEPASSVAKAASVATPTIQAPEKPLPADANQTGAARSVELAAVAPRPVSADTRPAPDITTPQEDPGFVSGHWRWAGPLALLALVGLVWLWRARFSAYDKAGLPRGPRL